MVSLTTKDSAMSVGDIMTKKQKTFTKGKRLIGNGIPLSQFEAESLKWRGMVLTGKYRHWCAEWDELPTDETCPEFEVCTCFEKEESYG